MSARDIVFGLMMIAGLLVIAVIEYQDVYMHEMAHARAFEFHGIKSETTIRVTGGSTRAVEREYFALPDEERRDLDNMNMMVEAVGYNMTGIKLSLYAIFYLIWGIFMARLYYEEN